MKVLIAVAASALLAVPVACLILTNPPGLLTLGILAVVFVAVPFYFIVRSENGAVPVTAHSVPFFINNREANVTGGNGRTRESENAEIHKHAA